MKIKSIIIFTLTSILFFLDYCYSQNYKQLASEYWNKAGYLMGQGRFLEAADYYEKSAVMKTRESTTTLPTVADRLHLAGICFINSGKLDKALINLDEALKIYKQYGREGNIAEVFGAQAEVDYQMHKFDTALVKYNLSLNLAKKLKLEDFTLNILRNIAIINYENGNLDAALRVNLEALKIYEGKREEDDKYVLILNFIGKIYLQKNESDIALEYFAKSLESSKRLGNEELILGYLYYNQELISYGKRKLENFTLEILKNIAVINIKLGHLDEALKVDLEAIKIFEGKSKENDEYVLLLNEIGKIYLQKNEPDTALRYYTQSLEISLRLENEGIIVEPKYYIAVIQYQWGQFELAKKAFLELLDNRFLNEEEYIQIKIDVYYRLGQVYFSLHKLELAEQYLEEALNVSSKVEDATYTAHSLQSLGHLNFMTAKYDLALKRFEAARDIFLNLEDENGIAILSQSFGLLWKALGQNDLAIVAFEQAAERHAKLNDDSNHALDLFNIAKTHFDLGNYSLTIEYLNKSMSITDKYLKKIDSYARKDYLDYGFQAYHLMIASYIKINDMNKAFNTIEKSRARLLFERLSLEDTLITHPTLQQVQESITDEQAILIYANVDLCDCSLSNKIMIVITKEDVKWLEISDSLFMKTMLKEYKATIDSILPPSVDYEKRIGSFKDRKVVMSFVEKSEIEFNRAIDFYRSTILNPSKKGNIDRTNKISRMLYDILIKPTEDRINNKKELIIITDGILGFIPFEILIDEENQYLVEQFNIRYANSVSILEMIKKREYNKKSNKVLALGGAIYENFNRDNSKLTDIDNLHKVRGAVYSSLENKKSLEDVYTSLGLNKWGDLAYSLDEVKTIGVIFDDVNIITGKELTEERIKELSNLGKLKEYSVIHFATHGLVNMAVPELSAIVLSQNNNGKSNNKDGYLIMTEVEQLELEANFVNLSACETGLGKIYRGEGVVGLAPSFILAGANSISVSLWQVEDRSTFEFMVAMYNLAVSEEFNYFYSINEIKRQFISGKYGEKYRIPYYWAPFVYYGK